MLALLLVLTPAADKPPELPPIPEVKLARAEAMDYARDVEPILADKCQYCHSGSVLKGGYNMGTFDGLLKGGKRGRVVVPGKAAESVLYRFSSHASGPVMPPPGEDQLTPEELAIIKRWIDEGAKPPAAESKARPRVVVGLPPALVRPVRALAVTPDRAAVVAGRGNRVHVFDAKTGAFLRSLNDPQLKTADGKPVAAAHLSLVESMDISPDGKTLATGSYGEVTLWNLADGTVRNRIDGFAERVVALAFSPDGTRLATGGGMPTEDGEVRVYRADGTLELALKSPHSDTVFGVRFSPDSNKLATCGADKFVKVWSLPAGKLDKSFEGHTNHVLDVAWKADGKLLVSAGADNAVKVWDYDKGEQARTIAGHAKQVTRLSVLGSKPEFVSVSGDQLVKRWNVDNGGAGRVYGGGKDFLYAVAASADGSVIAAGGEEGVVRLYNGDTGALIKALTPPE